MAWQKGKPRGSPPLDYISWNKRIPLTEEHKHKIGIANRGKVRSPATRDKISKSHKQRFIDNPELSAKVYSSLKEYYKTHPHPQKGKIIGKRGPYRKPTAMTGHKFTEETRKNMSIAKYRYWANVRKDYRKTQ